MTKHAYVFDNDPQELQRLILQAAVLRPVTERLLRVAQLGKGMHVLDLGCGAGDVSFLAADIVGPTGSVTAIDRDERALAIASERARAGGFSQIDFKLTTVEEFQTPQTFDLTIGRYVLIHQPDPAAFIRAAARHVKPNGVVCFHEISLYRLPGSHSLPNVDTWERMMGLVHTVLSKAAPSADAAGRLVEHFMKAGLPCPDLFAELPVGGGENSPLYDWLTETIRSLLPPLLKMGAVKPDEIALDTLTERMRTEAVAARSQIDAVPQVCGWARRGA